VVQGQRCSKGGESSKGETTDSPEEVTFVFEELRVDLGESLKLGVGEIGEKELLEFWGRFSWE